MREPMKKTQPQRRQNEDPHQWALQQRRAGELIGQPGHDSGQADARGHVCVDAQHVFMQASVHRRRAASRLCRSQVLIEI
ncbi:hypothetical protein ABH976_001503 [Bradyrhizobium ottawaense]